MNAFTYLKQCQIHWARRHHIPLQGSAGSRGEQAYTHTLEANLFEPLGEAARQEYAAGDGGELGNGASPGKMAAVHSSSALSVNVFHHWKQHSQPELVAKALKIPSTGLDVIRFERQLCVTAEGDRRVSSFDPNLDVVLTYQSHARTQMVGVECKFTEAYSSRRHAGIKRAYRDRDGLWGDLPHCRQLAEAIGDEDTAFPHLHAAQLIKHILGLKQAAGGVDRFRLLYLWYDTPFDEGYAHRREIQRFAEVVAQDHIRFQSLTYQELILNLMATASTDDAAYLAYLSERYL